MALIQEESNGGVIFTIVDDPEINITLLSPEELDSVQRDVNTIAMEDQIAELQQIIENAGDQLPKFRNVADLNATFGTSFPNFQCPGGPFKGIRIRFPGNTLNIKLPNIPEAINSGKQQVKKFFDMLNGLLSVALVPLGPIFTLFELVQAIVDCIEAINGGDSDVITECLVELNDKIAEAVNIFFPQLTIPLLVSDIICVIGQVLLNIINVIDDLITESKKLIDIQALAADFPGIEEDVQSLSCMVNLKQAGIEQALGALNSQIQLVNSFADLADVSLIPTLDNLVFDDLEALKNQLSSFRNILGNIPSTCLI